MAKASQFFKKAHRVLTVQRPKERDKPLVAKQESGAAALKATTLAAKKVLGGRSVLEGLGTDGEKAKVAALQVLAATDYTHGQGGSGYAPTVPLEIEKQAIVEAATGASPRYLEVKYGISAGYIRHALLRRYGSVENAKQALLGLVSEGAMACGVRALETIPNMSGPQAVMSGAILIDKMLALEKSIGDRPKTVDFSQLAEVGKTLRVLREIVDPPKPSL